jgi:uncharacterized repeat protein (TIGR02543 family)
MKKTVFFCLLAAALICGFIGCTSVDESSYSVIFHLDGGHIKGHPGSLALSVGYGYNIDDYENKKLPANPEKENYVFGGWFTAKNGFGNEFTKKTRVFSNLTVYAKWGKISEQ